MFASHLNTCHSKSFCSFNLRHHDDAFAASFTRNLQSKRARDPRLPQRGIGECSEGPAGRTIDINFGPFTHNLCAIRPQDTPPFLAILP